MPGYNANAYLTIFSASHLKIATLSMFRLKQFAEDCTNDQRFTAFFRSRDLLFRAKIQVKDLRKVIMTVSQHCSSCNPDTLRASKKSSITICGHRWCKGAVLISSPYYCKSKELSQLLHTINLRINEKINFF